MGNITIADCATTAQSFTDRLADPDWKPGRHHVEQLRNMVRDAGLLIGEMCEHSDGAVRVASDALAAGSALYRAYRSLLQAGRDRIIDAGGECDPVDVMERDDPALIAARSAFNIAIQNAGADKP